MGVNLDLHMKSMYMNRDATFPRVVINRYLNQIMMFHGW